MAVDEHGDVRAWPIPEPSEEPVGRLITRLPATIGLGLDSAREVSVLDPETWGRVALEHGLGGMANDFVDRETAWHEACARDAEALANSFAARWHLTRLIAARPGDAMLRARHGLALLLGGDPVAAMGELDRAIELGPSDRVVDWLVQRVEDLRTSGRPADALIILDRAIAARPDDWLCLAQRSEVLGALGRPAEREAAIAEAIERDPSISFLIRLGQERGSTGQWRQAAELYNRAIAQGTVPYEVWRQAAVACLAIDDVAGYRTVCETMRRRHPAAGLERWVAAELASVCTLGPDGVGDDNKAWTWLAGVLAGVPPDRKGWTHEFLTHKAHSSIAQDAFVRRSSGSTRESRRATATSASRTSRSWRWRITNPATRQRPARSCLSSSPSRPNSRPRTIGKFRGVSSFVAKPSA